MSYEVPVTYFDFTSGHVSFPPGPPSIRAKVGGCPQIKYIYEQDGDMQPAPYWVCVAFANANYNDVTLMSGIRKQHALRPFSQADVTYAQPANILAEVTSKKVQPVCYVSMEGMYWFKVVVNHYSVQGDHVSMNVQFDKKLVPGCFAYKGHNYYSENGLVPMVMESCGGNGFGAFNSKDNNDGNVMNFMDPGYVWKKPTSH